MKRRPALIVVVGVIIALGSQSHDARGQADPRDGSVPEIPERSEVAPEKNHGLSFVVSVESEGTMHFVIVNDGDGQLLLGSFVSVSWEWLTSEYGQTLGSCEWLIAPPRGYQLLEPRSEEFRRKGYTTSADSISHRAFLPKYVGRTLVEDGILSARAMGKVLTWNPDQQRFVESDFCVGGECKLSTK